jgi:hypothetical protein
MNSIKNSDGEEKRTGQLAKLADRSKNLHLPRLVRRRAFAKLPAE